MVVVTLSVCPPKLRGDLSKWLFEISPGVYVGTLSRRVREKLWDRICSMIGCGKATMVYRVHGEQRLAFMTRGTDWQVADYDGIQIMKHPRHGSCDDESTDPFPEQREDRTVPVIRMSKNEQKKPDRKKQELLPKDNYVVLDIETTGLDPDKDSITQIAAVKVEDGAIKEEFCRYVLCPPIPENISKLTGITNELVQEHGIPLRQALTELSVFIQTLPIVAHNSDFDITFLENGFEREGISFSMNTVFDTLKASRILVKGLKNYRLQTLLNHFGIETGRTHNALDDARKTFELVSILNKI